MTPGAHVAAFSAVTIVTLITALTALSAALIGPLITMRTARAQINATVISANRQRWIETMRDLVALFCSQTTAAAFVRDKLVSDGRLKLGDDPEMLRRIELQLLTTAKIRLLINPTEADHRQLVEAMDAVILHLRTAPSGADLEEEVQLATAAIVGITQGVLKREWVRVKHGE